MKKLSLLVAFLICNLSFAQEIPQLKSTLEGVEPIVVTIDDLSAEEIYKKSINWVKETYKNPEEVLKADIENEKIRIVGYDPNAWYFMSMGSEKNMSINYTVEISFKEGKYRFEYVIDKLSHNYSYKGPFKYESMYNKKGELKKAYLESVPAIDKTMNTLSTNYYNYITGKAEGKEW